MTTTTTPTSRFNTLLLREWMQHHRGWLALMLAPPLLFLLIVPFGTVEFERDELGPLPAVGMMLAAMFMVPAIVLGITAIALLFQTASLARRDRQDRSIEFWLSLPSSHTASVAAPVLMHLIVVPLLALTIGAALSYAIGIALVWKVFGAAQAAALPWSGLLAVGATGFVRGAVGVLLALFWLMPLLLAQMAASAWLKRWGTPVLVLALVIGHKLLASLYGITLIGSTVTALVQQAGRALVHGVPPRPTGSGAAALAWMADAQAWLLADGLAALRDLAQPLALFALAASAACFALMVLRRARSG